MKLAFLLLATAGVAVMAQDTMSATGEACEAHGDHWHCPSGVPEPTTPPAAVSESVSATPVSTPAESSATSAAASCEAHGDHWHCPSGVSEPTTPPPAETTGAHTDDHDHHDEHEATASACEAHGDHWHCPSGIAEPTTPPATITASSSSAGNVTGSTTAPTQSQFTGGAFVATTNGGMMVGLFGAVGMLFV